MSNIVRKGAVVAASAAVALGGIAAPAATAKGKGHHSNWSAAKCQKQATQWSKSHKHPTKKQEKAEAKLLKKHGCK